MRHPRILNSAAQADESEGFDEGTTPLERLAGSEPRAHAFPQQATQTVFDKSVHVVRLRRRVPGTEILRPAAEHGIEIRNDSAEILVTARARRQIPYAS